MIYSTLKNKSNQFLVLLSIPVLMALAVGKDLIHAAIKGYIFYWSESLLFETFWLLFVPILLITRNISRNNHPTVALLSPLTLGVLHLALFAILVYSISSLFFSHTFGFNRIFIDALSDHGVTCLLIYAAAEYVFSRTGNPSRAATPPLQKIKVQLRNRVVLLSSDEIVYVKTDRPYIALVTEDHTYLHNDTLKGFMVRHLSDQFVRIHKSTVVNTDCIASYTSRGNGDYDIVLTNGDTIRASRNYNHYFSGPGCTNRLD